jgi:16S rRNA (cytidine1402-2'-O)-methyltransferase
MSSLLLIPTPLDFGLDASAPLDELLPRATLRTASELGHWVVENAKSARAFLKRVDAVLPLAQPLQQLQIVELPRAQLVALAHAQGFAVRSLPGSSSLVQALAASGLNGQGFSFVGYLPQEAAARTARIRELEQVSKRTGHTQIAIETPYRNTALLEALVATLQPGARLAVSCALTTAAEWTRSSTVAQWRAKPSALPKDQPAIFSWLASG